MSVREIHSEILSDKQKQHRLQVAQEMINRSENVPDLLNRVITDDKSWVYGYDPETKAQSSQWKNPGSPQPKKARRCWWSFSIPRVSCIMNMSLGARQSTRNTIKVSLSDHASFLYSTAEEGLGVWAEIFIFVSFSSLYVLAALTCRLDDALVSLR